MDERKAQREIADWISEAANAEVYWAEDPPKEYDRFSFTGTGGRPDLLAVSDRTTVVEMKDGTDSAGVYDAMADIHEYWRSYEFGNTTVQTDETSVKVDAFVVTTQFSTDGHLFKQDPEDTAPAGDDREKGFRKTYSDNETWNEGLRPQYEYARTEAIPRIMWRYAWSEAENRQNVSRENINTGLGVLLSDTLDTNPKQTGFDEFTASEETLAQPKVLYYDGKDGSQWVSV